MKEFFTFKLFSKRMISFEPSFKDVINLKVFKNKKELIFKWKSILLLSYLKTKKE